MASVSLEFRGVENAGLLMALGIAIAVALVGYGFWQLAAGKVRRGLVALVCGLLVGGPVVAVGVAVPLRDAVQCGLWIALLAGAIILAVGVFYSAVYAYLGRRRLTALLALRFLAILALLLILFKPAISVQPSADETKLVVPVLVDRSGSMNTIDHADLPNRYSQAIEALLGQRDRLTKGFRVQWYHFAAKPQAAERLEDLAGLSPSGPETDQTDINQAIRRAVTGYGADELAGVILISDGLHNAAGDPVEAARECPAPIYTIGVGSESETAGGQRNVALAGVEAPLEAVRNNVATVAAKVRVVGFASIPFKVTLKENGREVDSKQVLAESNAQTVPVQFKWTPGDGPADQQGPDVRTLQIAVEPNPAETTADDNVADIHVLVTQPGIRVLYVEGTMRPEYKYLHRVLSTDPNIKFMSLVRIAENKFLAQGSIDGKSLADLPRTDEEFRFFDVLILGDLDRTFLSNDQLDKIRRFVNDGKSLLMLGGRNSLGPGGYGDTPVEAALPVACGGRGQPQETTPFVPQLTAAGAASPIFAGLEEFFDTPAGKAKKPVPELLGCVTVAAAKPGATVLAIHPTRRTAEGQPLVVLAAQQFGAGRSAVFTADTTWQWFLRLRPMGADSPYHRFWGQLVRWLAGAEKKQAKVGSSVLARLDAQCVPQGQEVKITAQVRGGDGQPADQASVTAAFKTDKNDRGVLVTLAHGANPAGIYEGTYRPGKPGKFTLAVSAADGQGKALGADELPLTVESHSRETDRLARDAAMLQGIARRGPAAAALPGSGKYAELSALPEIVDELLARQRTRVVAAPAAQVYPMYNFPLLFLVFVGLLTAEWLLRRNWQLQ